MGKKISRRVKQRKKKKARNRAKAEILKRNARLKQMVVRFNDKSLYQKADEVDSKTELSEINEKLGFDLIGKMKQIICAFPDGAGLSANQIGCPYRISIIRFDTSRNDAFVMINPVITEKSDDVETEVEGCLSFPGYYTGISRAKDIVVKYFDEDFREQEIKYSGYKARIVQHEIDHNLGTPSLAPYYRKKKQLT